MTLKDLTEDEVEDIAICLLACSRSGGGSRRYSLYRKVCDQLGREPESDRVVDAQFIARSELP